MSVSTPQNKEGIRPLFRIHYSWGIENYDGEKSISYALYNAGFSVKQVNEVLELGFGAKVYVNLPYQTKRVKLTVEAKY